MYKNPKDGIIWNDFKNRCNVCHFNDSHTYFQTSIIYTRLFFIFNLCFLLTDLPILQYILSFLSVSFYHHFIFLSMLISYFLSRPLSFIISFFSCLSFSIFPYTFILLSSFRLFFSLFPPLFILFYSLCLSFLFVFASFIPLSFFKSMLFTSVNLL